MGSWRNLRISELFWVPLESVIDSPIFLANIIVHLFVDYIYDRSHGSDNVYGEEVTRIVSFVVLADQPKERS